MNIINLHKSIPLNGEQVLELVDYKANLVKYRDLNKFRNIDDVLGKYGACFILFEFEVNMGHWVALYKENNTIYFFNSYSGYPDDTLSGINKDFRKISNQNYPYLSKLLYDSPYELEYNDVKLQSNGSKIMTCGRWCALFIMMRNQHIDNFSKLFNSKVGDDVVTIITMWITNSDLNPPLRRN